MKINQMRARNRGVVLALAVLLAGPVMAQSTGSADLSHYVALGDSLTAAFISGGLVETAQRNSYSALIHRQAVGGAFEQPLVSEPGIPPVLQLVSLQGPVIAPSAPLESQGFPINLKLPRPYDNLGVPGAKVGDVVRTVTGGLHDLVLRGLGTQLQQALALQPTFASLWVGNNDVLGAATSGIVIEGVTLTPAAAFEADYRTIVETLSGAGARLALATIPAVTAIPFVSTVPPILVNPATRQPVLVNGAPVPLIGPQGPLSLADKVLLTAGGLLAQGIGIPQAFGGTGLPLPDQVVLDAAEVATIVARTNRFNEIIRTVAGEHGAALVDIAAVFDDIVAHGLNLGGIELGTDFLTGGLFSYDGVHATPLGYAVIANEFLRAINRTYGGSIPLVGLLPFVRNGLAVSSGNLLVAGGKEVRLSAEAEAQLRFVQGLPSTEALLQIKRRREDRNRPPSGSDEPPSPHRPGRPNKP